MQWQFIKKTVRLMPGIHVTLDTSGYASDEVFLDAMETVDLILMDIKLIDPALHQKYTGVDNSGILRHVRMLCQGQTPFIVRVPVIPGVNDNPAFYQATAEILQDAQALRGVELLPYQQTAGAKYEMVDMTYAPKFDPQVPVRIDTKAFEDRHIPVKAFT